MIGREKDYLTAQVWCVSRRSTYNGSFTDLERRAAAAPPPPIMQSQTHRLISPAVGTARHITSFHYVPRGGKKVDI
ncbi:succinylglutamate desuccinylase, partial [Burkholderia pseudomallei]